MDPKEHASVVAVAVVRGGELEVRVAIKAVVVVRSSGVDGVVVVLLCERLRERSEVGGEEACDSRVNQERRGKDSQVREGGEDQMKERKKTAPGANERATMSGGDVTAEGRIWREPQLWNSSRVVVKMRLERLRVWLLCLPCSPTPFLQGAAPSSHVAVKCLPLAQPLIPIAGTHSKPFPLILIASPTMEPKPESVVKDDTIAKKKVENEDLVNRKP
ncbi:hypothetical protein RIF29_32889 [Crotalaria pallida]|uniref:Uncharacterized protein n=1 Tax=Crotalaria pallida TaxID=3830 RepID=A0AAN9E750_CROPI